MDDWLAPPQDRAMLPMGRLCVIMALTILLLVMTIARDPDRGALQRDAVVDRAG